MRLKIDEFFFTLSEAAVELGVERHTIGRWAKSGKLEVQKVGGMGFVDKQEVERLKAELKG